MYTLKVCTRSKYVHDQSMYTLKVCTRSKYVHAQSMYTLKVCTRSKYVHAQSMYTLKVCTRSKYEHAQCMYTLKVCTRSKYVHAQSMYTLNVCTRSKLSIHFPICSFKLFIQKTMSSNLHDASNLIIDATFFSRRPIDSRYIPHQLRHLLISNDITLDIAFFHFVYKFSKPTLLLYHSHSQEFWAKIPL